MRNLINFIFLILIIFIFGCQSAQEGREKFTINLIKGTGFIYDGKTIFEGEPFRVGLELINYDKKEKEGIICVYDNQHSYYGGIDKECINFYVASAIGEKEKNPSISKIYFPKEGYFSYINLPSIDINPEIYIKSAYKQESQFVNSLNYPYPEIESFTNSDDFLSIKIEKSIHQTQSNYKILLDIKIEKRKNINISIDEKNNFIYFFIEARPLTFSCNIGKRNFIQSSIIDLEKENFIRCEALTNSMNQETLPLVIKVNYKIEDLKKIKINVKNLE